MTAGSLDELMIRHGTDKSSLGHDYADAYATLLAPLRFRFATMLEIGAGTGASLRVWRDYLPLATVYGIDLTPPDGLDGVFVGDQTDAAFLGYVLDEIGPPNFVIDDGGHRASEQVASFETIFPRLASGGVYVVEDTHAWYQGGTGNYAAARASGDERTLPEWSPLVASLRFFQSLLAIWRR